MIPKIDLHKWYELDLDFDQIAEIVRHFEDAKRENMRVNVLMGVVYEIVKQYNKTAQIFNVSPTTASRRVKDRAGVSDRVLSGVVEPFTVEQVMKWLRIPKLKVDGVVAFCANSPTRYSTRDKLRELLDAFYISDAMQEVIIGEVLDNLK